MYKLSEELFAEDMLLNESVGTQIFERFDRHFSSDNVNLKEDRKVLVETFISLGYLNEDADIKKLDKKDIKDEKKVKGFAEKVKSMYMKVLNAVQTRLKSGDKLTKEDKAKTLKDIKTLSRLVRMLKTISKVVETVIEVITNATLATLSILVGIVLAHKGNIVAIGALLAGFVYLYQLVMVIVRIVRRNNEGKASKIEKRANDMKSKVDKHKAKLKAKNA